MLEGLLVGWRTGWMLVVGCGEGGGIAGKQVADYVEMQEPE